MAVDTPTGKFQRAERVRARTREHAINASLATGRAAAAQRHRDAQLAPGQRAYVWRRGIGRRPG
eukprot:1347692-Lingulodinium_polyedra.AAC.1